MRLKDIFLESCKAEAGDDHAKRIITHWANGRDKPVERWTRVFVQIEPTLAAMRPIHPCAPRRVRHEADPDQRNRYRSWPTDCQMRQSISDEKLASNCYSRSV